MYNMELYSFCFMHTITKTLLSYFSHKQTTVPLKHLTAKKWWCFNGRVELLWLLRFAVLTSILCCAFVNTGSKTYLNLIMKAVKSWSFKLCGRVDSHLVHFV